MFVFSICFILYTANIYAKTIYYVKTDGAGNGSSWVNAANNIQTMIDKAVSGDEVWVAKGTYYPTTETIARDSRSRTFLLKDGVNMFGGFAGSESAISQRALADLNGDGKVDSCELVNSTILSGDIDGITDVWTKSLNSNGKTWKWTVTGNTGNCYRVVTCQTMFILNPDFNGFTIIGGNANSTNFISGGGIYNCPKISNCMISNCYAISSGGGIYSSYSTYNSSVSITNCLVSNCYADTIGGGICSYYSSTSYPASAKSGYIKNSLITNCSAGSSGGGIYSNSSAAGPYEYYATDAKSTAYNYVINCMITNCSAGSSGGGIYSNSLSHSIHYPSNSDANSYVLNCMVNNCAAGSFGGGIYSDAYSSPIKNCITNASANVNNCNVINCYSANNSGGIYSNSTIGVGIYSGSTATGSSGVVSCVVTNCDGGGICSTIPSASSNSFVKNCLSNAIVGGTQTGNISPDIKLAFAKPTSFVGLASTESQRSELLNADWRLIEGSPCINAGFGSRTIDLDGNQGVLYGTIDIGAFEFNVPKISIPALENFDTWTDFNNSQVFYRSAKLNTLNDIKWTIVNQKADFSWQTNLTSTYSQPIFTYQIDATKSSKVYLRYDMFFQAYAGTISPLGTEKLNVEFSKDLVTWSTIATYSNANGTIANQTYKHDISSLAAGKTFFIRFNANGANSNRIEKWEIDNVIIDADGLSAVNTVPEDKYKYSINNGVLNIANLGQVATIQLFDINGKILANKAESQTANFTLPVHGVYIVKVASESGVENKKIVW
jgi:hypothetical protein